MDAAVDERRCRHSIDIGRRRRDVVVEIAGEIEQLLLPAGPRNEGRGIQMHVIVVTDSDNPLAYPVVQDGARADIGGDRGDQRVETGLPGRRGTGQGQRLAGGGRVEGEPTGDDLTVAGDDLRRGIGLYVAFPKPADFLAVHARQDADSAVGTGFRVRQYVFDGHIHEQFTQRIRQYRIRDAVLHQHSDQRPQHAPNGPKQGGRRGRRGWMWVGHGGPCFG